MMTLWSIKDIESDGYSMQITTNLNDELSSGFQNEKSIEHGNDSKERDNTMPRQREIPKINTVAVVYNGDRKTFDTFIESMINDFNNMITKREDEIAKLDKKISDLREYDKICKQRKEHLNNTTQIIDEILSEGSISDVNLRMLVKRILIHQNEDKSLDIKFEMNGEFNDTVSVFIDPMDELESA